MAETKNYLLINKKGDWYNYEKTSWDVAHTTYIRTVIGGYEKIFKLDSDTWDILVDKINDNRPEIDLFNALLTDPSLQIAKCIYNHQLIYPTVGGVVESTTENVTNYFIINELGRYFEYKKDSNESTSSLSKALRAYIENAIGGYSCSFSLSKEKWEAIDAKIDDDTIRLKTFNKLCKKNTHKIAVIAANYSNVYPI